jgi:membrane-associated phospholipid phosphatase
MVWTRTIALALAIGIAPAARAAEPPVPLRYNLALDTSITGGVLLTSVLFQVFQSKMAPSTCHWCAPGGIDASVRNALVWDDRFRTADVLSSIVAMGIVPVSAVGYLILSAHGRGDTRAGLVDSLLVVEAASVALLLNQTVKLLVARQRPYAYYGHDVGASANETNLSFYGGHGSFAFSVAAATVTLASMRGYSGTAAVAGVGFAAAAGVAYLRMAADQHYLSDVLVGAVVGGLVGWAIPRFLHSPEPGAPQPGALRLAPGALAIAF